MKYSRISDLKIHFWSAWPSKILQSVPLTHHLFHINCSNFTFKKNLTDVFRVCPVWDVPFYVWWVKQLLKKKGGGGGNIWNNFNLKLIFAEEFSYLSKIMWIYLQTEIIHWVKVSCHFSMFTGQKKHPNTWSLKVKPLFPLHLWGGKVTVL